MVMEVTRGVYVGSLRQRQKPGLQEPSTHDSQAWKLFGEGFEIEVMRVSCGLES
jgi:hypothetical protein